MIIDYKELRLLSLRMAESGYILIFGEFNEFLEEIVIECILRAKGAGSKKLTVLINSGGGFNSNFAAIKSSMVESGISFEGIVMGKAASNAFNLLQLCEVRKASKESFLMFHWGSQRLNNWELAALINGEEWPIKNAVNAELLNAAQVSKRTGVSTKNLTKFALYERWVQGKEALSLNFIDEIIDDLPVGLREKLGQRPVPEIDNKKKRRKKVK